MRWSFLGFKLTLDGPLKVQLCVQTNIFVNSINRTYRTEEREPDLHIWIQVVFKVANQESEYAHELFIHNVNVDPSIHEKDLILPKRALHLGNKILKSSQKVKS